MEAEPIESELPGLMVSGGIAVLLGLAIAAVAMFANPGARGVRDWRILFAPAVLFVTMGIGTLARQRWAVVILAIGFGAPGLWLVLGSLLYVPFPWLMINVAFGSVACVPAWLAYRGWSDLKRV